MIGRRCFECLELVAADDAEVCQACALDLQLRAANEAGQREGWAACAAFHGLVPRGEADGR